MWPPFDNRSGSRFRYRRCRCFLILTHLVLPRTRFFLKPLRHFKGFVDLGLAGTGGGKLIGSSLTGGMLGPSTPGGSLSAAVPITACPLPSTATQSGVVVQDTAASAVGLTFSPVHASLALMTSELVAVGSVEPQALPLLSVATQSRAEVQDKPRRGVLVSSKEFQACSTKSAWLA